MSLEWMKKERLIISIIILYVISIWIGTFAIGWHLGFKRCAMEVDKALAEMNRNRGGTATPEDHITGIGRASIYE